MNGLRVLLLDNDGDALRLASDMLAAEGYTVYACATCEHATRIATLLRPHVFLFHGCDGDEAEAFRALLAADSCAPLVYFSRDHNAYEVYTAKSRNGTYRRIGNLINTPAAAIRAALLHRLEAI